MTLLIPADPVPQLLLGPIVCVGVWVHEYTFTHTQTHTQPETTPHTVPIVCALPLSTHLPASTAIAYPTYMPIRKTLTWQPGGTP